MQQHLRQAEVLHLPGATRRNSAVSDAARAPRSGGEVRALGGVVVRALNRAPAPAPPPGEGRTGMCSSASWRRAAGEKGDARAAASSMAASASSGLTRTRSPCTKKNPTVTKVSPSLRFDLRCAQKYPLFVAIPKYDVVPNFLFFGICY